MSKSKYKTYKLNEFSSNISKKLTKKEKNYRFEQTIKKY